MERFISGSSIYGDPASTGFATVWIKAGEGDRILDTQFDKPMLLLFADSGETAKGLKFQRELQAACKGPAAIQALDMTIDEMRASRLPWSEEASECSVLESKKRGMVEFPPTDFYPNIPDKVMAVVMKRLCPNKEHGSSDSASVGVALNPAEAADRRRVRARAGGTRAPGATMTTTADEAGSGARDPRQRPRASDPRGGLSSPPPAREEEAVPVRTL